MSLREKKKHETRNRIFDVSTRLFKEKGFENTTVDEITKEAGIAKGTFFNYFPTKESLLFYFRQQKEELIINILQSQVALNVPVKEKIKNFLFLLAQNYEKDRELVRLLFFEHRKLMITSRQRASGNGHKHHGFASILCELLHEGVEKGEIRQDLDMMVASDTLNAIYFHSLITWLHSDAEYSFSRDMSDRVDILFEGIGV
ncbi:TetR/AcrR family transcriptional regulator [Methanolobus sp. WCC5]|uniref:TetR/AcrR family transcriptional regulator n=1 Tax=Methanolobus sp. WCC5 TaxID=3125785 RepID=UPI003249377F